MSLREILEEYSKSVLSLPLHIQMLLYIFNSNKCLYLALLTQR